MKTSIQKDYLNLIEHQSFSLKNYKQYFVKSFLDLSHERTIPTFTRDLKIKIASEIYESFFSNKPTDLESSIQVLSSHMKSTASIEYLLYDLFLQFISDYSRSLITHANHWHRLTSVVAAIDLFLKRAGNTPKQEQKAIIAKHEIMSDDLAINFLEEMRQASKTLKVLNTYHGVPIEFSAKIIHTSAIKVIIKAHPLQDIAARYQGGIYILCENEFGSDLYAKVKPRILKGHDVLELSSFDQLSSSIHKRQTVRVYPEIKTNVLINNFTVTLFDISIGGIAVITPRALKLELFENVVVKIPDILFGNVINYNAELIHVSRYENGFKYHFKLHLNPSTESETSKFIIKRQKEIISELKEQLI